MQLFSGVRVDGIDHEVGVQVGCVQVGRHQHLASGEEFFRQFQGDLVGLFRGDRFIRREGLVVVVEVRAVGFVVQIFGRHEALVGQVCHAVDAGEVSPAVLVHSLFLLGDIAQDAAHRSRCLFGLLDVVTRRHG